MRIIDQTHIAIPRVDLKEMLKLSESNDDIIIELPETASIIDTTAAYMLRKASDQVAEEIMVHPDLKHITDFRYIAFSKTELSDVISYYMYEEHIKDKLEENVYTSREIENTKDFVMDGLKAVCGSDNLDFTSYKVDYITLNIIMYGIFHRKTASTITEAIKYHDCLDQRAFHLRAIGTVQVNAIAKSLYGEYPNGAPYPGAEDM